MTRSGPGWYPLAHQVEGVETFTTGGEPKVGFCDHTAGGFYTTLANAGFWNGAGVSVHFAISRKGDIAQIVNIFDTAWAQGRDARGQPVGPDSPGVSWPPFAAMGKRNPNGYLISTEHEDYELVNGQSHAIADSRWTPEEYAADLRVKRWCANELASHGVDVMRFGLDSLASHHMFDPVNRAYCAGKAWRDEYRQRLFNDLTKGAPMPSERIWLYGSEAAGEEVVGKQIYVWHLGVVIDKIGDEAGQLPGKRLHNEGGVFVEKEP